MEEVSEKKREMHNCNYASGTKLSGCIQECCNFEVFNILQSTFVATFRVSWHRNGLFPPVCKRKLVIYFAMLLKAGSQ